MFRVFRIRISPIPSKNTQTPPLKPKTPKPPGTPGAYFNSGNVLKK